MDRYEFERAEIDALERVVGDPREKPIMLSFWLLRHITNNFSDESMIGIGGFSKVYLGVLPNGPHIAVKRLFNTIEDRAFRHEVDTTMKVAHKNIVRLIGYCSYTQEQIWKHEGGNIYLEFRERLICMEYVPNGTLEAHITDKFHGGLNWDQRYKILKGICHGLHYLHGELRIIHRDIKPENILLKDNLVPKFSDFGFSKCLGDEESFIEDEGARGTIGYMAPESIFHGKYSFKSDIYSFGVAIIQLLTGSRISENRNVELALKQLRKRLVKEGAFSSWENKYHQVRTCLEIGYTCMEMDEDKRPTALEIIDRLDETESVNHSAPPLWQSMQSGDEESDSSDTDAFETETTTEFVPSDEEPASADTTGETSAQEDDMPDLQSKLCLSAELSSLDFLEKITDGFSHERIIGKDGPHAVVHKAFVYEGNISGRTVVAVKRLIGVEIKARKFEMEAKRLLSLDHKNVVKLLGYCHDESRGHKLVQFKGKQLQDFKGAEQLLCYEYMHNGSLREYLIGQGSREVDWHMCYKLIKGTCEGLRYLHEGCGDRPILHLNLSPSNVLLDENNVPRITGFDFSKLIGEKNTKSVFFQMNGPLGYLPPDFLYSKGTDLKYLATVDIYSLGLIILEIATRQEIKGDHGIIIKTVENNWRQDSQIATLYGSLEDRLREQVKMCVDIGLHCVKSNPGDRPTAGEIMLWLDKGSKPGVARPPLRANVTHADEHIQEKEKQTPLRRFFRRK